MYGSSILTCYCMHARKYSRSSRYSIIIWGFLGLIHGSGFCMLEWPECPVHGPVILACYCMNARK
jgi:hypothetical protein